MGLVSTDSLRSAGEVIQLFPWRGTDMSENLFCFPCRKSPWPLEELQMQNFYAHTIHKSRVSEVGKIKPEIEKKNTVPRSNVTK